MIPKSVSGFSDEIMRKNKDVERASVSIETDRALLSQSTRPMSNRSCNVAATEWARRSVFEAETVVLPNALD
jgi:hypothetical protein